MTDTEAWLTKSNNLNVYDLTSGMFKRSVQLDRTVSELTFSASGNRLVGLTQDGRVVVVDPSTGRSAIPIDSKRVVEFDVSQSGRYVAITPGDLHVIDLESGRYLAELKKTAGRVRVREVSGGFVVSSWRGVHRGSDGILVPVVSWPPLEQHALSSDGTLAAAVDHGRVRIYDLTTGTLLRTLDVGLTLLTLSVPDVDFVGSDDLLMLKGNATVFVRARTGQLVGRLSHVPRIQTLIELSPTGRHWVASPSGLNGRLLIHDGTAPGNFKILNANRLQEFSGDGERMAEVNGVDQAWRLRVRESRHNTVISECPIARPDYSLSVDGDEAVTTDKTTRHVQVIDTATGGVLRTYDQGQTGATPFWTPDGRFIAVNRNGPGYVLDASTLDRVSSLSVASARFKKTGLSGSKAVTWTRKGIDGTIYRFVDLLTGQSDVVGTSDYDPTFLYSMRRDAKEFIHLSEKGWLVRSLPEGRVKYRLGGLCEGAVYVTYVGEGQDFAVVPKDGGLARVRVETHRP